MLFIDDECGLLGYAVGVKYGITIDQRLTRCLRSSTFSDQKSWALGAAFSLGVAGLTMVGFPPKLWGRKGGAGGTVSLPLVLTR